MTSQDVSDALKKANAALIRYPRFQDIHEEIRLCQEMSKIAGEPQCIGLEGMTGAGKSTLMKAYRDAFSRDDTPSGTRISVFYMEVPSPVTVKGLAARMLEALGDPGAHRGTLWSMNFRLIHYLKACEVQIVILDDFHHLIDADKNRVLEQVTDWLKVLIKESGVPFLVVGLEGKIELILATNRQLSRLFAVRETLQPFRCDKDFHTFVASAESAIGCTLDTGLDRVELLHRLHFATDGVVGNVMNLLRYATLLVAQTTVESLTLSVLEKAYAQRLQRHMRSQLNPFASDIGPRFTPPPAKQKNEPNATSGRRRRSKAPQPTAAEVLTTS